MYNNENMAEGSGTGSKDLPRQEIQSELQIAEQNAWVDVLGTIVDVTPLPSHITPEIRQKLEALGMELRFVPKLDLQENYLRDNSAQAYLWRLNSYFPKWQPYERLLVDERPDPKIVRNLISHYWEEVKKGAIDFPALPGQWIAVETSAQPSNNLQSPLTTAMGLTTRIGLMWNEVQEKLPESKENISKQVGLGSDGGNRSIEFRLLRALEWNLLANRQHWKETDQEWLEDIHHDSRGLRHLVARHSTHPRYKGTNSIMYDFPDIPNSSFGFRPALILNP